MQNDRSTERQKGELRNGGWALSRQQREWRMSGEQRGGGGGRAIRCRNDGWEETWISGVDGGLTDAATAVGIMC